jgi:DsbC/DsbD-like thiol-disulfide interchange protein
MTMNTGIHRVTSAGALIALAIVLCVSSFVPAAAPAFAASINPEALLQGSGGPPQRPGVASARAEDVQATVALSSAKAAAGSRLAVRVDIQIGPGWHIYGEPLPANYVPTSLSFDNDLLAEQSIKLPRATPVNFKALGETLPVYKGHVKGSGAIVLKPGLKPGDYRIGGELKFQECNDRICKMPRAVKFEIPITIAAAH